MVDASPNFAPVDLADEFAKFGEFLEQLQKPSASAALHAAEAELLENFPQLKPEPRPPKPKTPPGKKPCKACGRVLPLVSFSRHPKLATAGRPAHQWCK
jgi:hypothetical protein